MSLPKIYQEDPLFKMPRVYLTDEVYSQALDAFIIVCTDAAIVDKQNKLIYLAYRKALPAQGWWVLGGRTYAGESFEESVVRCVKRETGIELDKSRFNFEVINRYQFPNRAQAPQEKGCDTMSFTFSVELTREEILSMSQALDEKEYDKSYGLKAFNYEELQKTKVHPMILDLYKLIFP